MLIDTMQQQYKAARQEIKVPELGDTVIHFTPLTMGERLALNENAEQPLKLMAQVVALKSEDAEGNRMFTDGDLAALMDKCDAEVVSKIASAIMGVSDIDGEMGNSESSQS